MTRRQYPNPPIEEAVCEFRFAPGQRWNLTVPGLFYERIRDTYPGEPRQQNLIQAELQIEPAPDNPELAFRHDFIKLLFQSADTKKLVGVGANLLSIHSLRPYEGWENFSERISKAFHTYLDVAKPVGVTRIALRYINKVAVAVNREIELSEYFTVYPQLPDGVPSRISGFLTRTESIYEDIPIRLVITLSDDLPPAGQVMFTLDLEASQEWLEKPLAIESALSSLYELKQREGQAFENLITDRTRELFNVS
ncbi:TIGR04255 family protein [Nostoc sp. TCL26-01]|uniref:TIGR04255 family protein n=1 Tax=Nostoc sp. TCL26-01 TaxID=2576904 RepID=UPI0015BD8763|nr:TIGR04255 family protein [Nostoc sp. TCL26-01]QLE55979.1 TIGR04255 family protein [Nostoc sp. TCL26-01]